MSSTLNATAATLLGFLHEGPMTGFDLLKKAEEVTGEFWNVTKSQVYRELKSLAADGSIAMRATGPRDRQPYSITRAGRAAFASWIALPPGPLNMRFPLALTVFPLRPKALGCETSVSADALNCGACGAACGTNNITGSCAASKCVYQCKGNYAQCWHRPQSGV